MTSTVQGAMPLSSSPQNAEHFEVVQAKKTTAFHSVAVQRPRRTMGLIKSGRATSLPSGSGTWNPILMRDTLMYLDRKSVDDVNHGSAAPRQAMRIDELVKAKMSWTMSRCSCKWNLNEVDTDTVYALVPRLHHSGYRMRLHHSEGAWRVVLQACTMHAAQRPPAKAPRRSDKDDHEPTATGVVSSCPCEICISCVLDITSA